jgi:hypothetical protein
VAVGSIALLTLTGVPDLVAVSGPHASDFAVTLPPSSPIGAGDSTTFSVRFDPSGAGLRHSWRCTWTQSRTWTQSSRT